MYMKTAKSSKREVNLLRLPTDWIKQATSRKYLKGFPWPVCYVTHLKAVCWNRNPVQISTSCASPLMYQLIESFKKSRSGVNSGFFRCYTTLLSDPWKIPETRQNFLIRTFGMCGFWCSFHSRYQAPRCVRITEALFSLRRIARFVLYLWAKHQTALC